MTDDRVLKKVADTLLAEDLETWNFGVSVAFEGLIAASDVLADATYEAYAWGYLRGWAAERRPFRELDCTFPGLAAVRIALRRDDRMLLRMLTDLAEWLVERPTIRGIYRTWRHSPLMQPYGAAKLDAGAWSLLHRPPPGSFVDCLHFEPPFLTGLGRVLGRKDLVEAGAAQCRAYIDQLQTSAGTFDHFILDGIPGSLGPGWGRGQGWALLGLLDTYEELVACGHDAADIAQSARRLIAAMVDRQQEDGHWPAQLDTDGSTQEYSTAAFMAYGMTLALERGLVRGDDVRDSAARARAATVAGIDADGVLREVSAAVMACTEPSHYSHVPCGFNVPWGQGPAVMALTVGSGS